MVRTYYVECPECATEFPVHHGELRGTDTKLLCPTCGHRFADEQAATIRE